MIVIFGEKSYGKVDRVPGVCYVVTIFAHLNFLPLIPLRSYIVIEGTESGGEFRGKEISVSLKSALAGYARAWVGLVAAAAGAVAAFGLWNAAGALGIADLGGLGVAAFAVSGVLALFVRGKAGGAVQIGAHVVSAVLWFAFSNPGRNAPQWAIASAQSSLLALFLANAALLLFGLTRLFDRAGSDRRRELLRVLGVELPADDESDEEPRESRWEDWDESEDRRRR